MTLPELTTILKAQFDEISAALYNGSLNIEYLDETNRVFGEASSMFGANVLRYSESNFEYFYLYHKHLIANLDIVNLTVLNPHLSKLETKGDILSLVFIKQAESSELSISNERQFLELNLVANIFVFLHEAGHINQEIPPESETKETNHFAEFNADYYAISKILNYYHALRHSFPGEYKKRMMAFGSEQNLMRCVIVTAFTVVYFDCITAIEGKETQTHPEIRKRFCYLMYQLQIQLAANFGYLFQSQTLSAFLARIFDTLDLIERELFSKEQLVFIGILDFCAANSEETKNYLKHNEKFTRFNN